MLRQLEFLCFMIIKYHRLPYLTVFGARLMTAVHTGVIINSSAKRSLGHLPLCGLAELLCAGTWPGTVSWSHLMFLDFSA